MIEAKDVSCTFARNPFSKEGFVAVSPVSIQFIDGERYAIVGESGSGKTTLARMIAGLQRPTTGNIYVDGMPVYGKHKVHTNYFKEVQIIQQDSSSALDPKMSVGRSIEEPLLCFFHLDKGERKKRCHDLMDLCNLPVEYYSRLPAELSGGEQKRVAIARALAAEPSLLENIRAGRPSATREEVLKAAHLAQCDDILKKLPNGIDTIIGSQGIYLSGGETQRISIARAILKDAPIVVLDEATAYADPENEHQIQKAFDGLIKNKTVIMIAHRLSTVQDADQILVMKNGAIVESGTHSDLIKLQGEYAKMWDNYNKTVQWHIES